MKKTLLLILLAGAFCCMRLHAQFTITNLNLAAQHSGVAVVDIDHDGDLDILISGEDGADRNVQLFKNDGAGTFTPASSNFPALTRTTFDWNDINQDGKMDAIISGFPAAGPPFDSVYTSDGAGNFTQNTSYTIAQQAPGSGFADLNNDGYLDIYVFGNKFEGHPKIYFNNKAGGFTESDQFDAYNLIDPVVYPVDFDNDQDLDLFVIAGDQEGSGRFTQMFINNNGTFTAHDFGFDPKGNGSITWADYNKDGYLDVLYNGDGVPGDDWKYMLYKNNAGTSFTFEDSLLYRQNHTGNGSRMVDWDNDGDIDLIVTGYNGTTQATDIYLNNGSGTFSAYAGNATIPGFSENSIETADVDGDGDLDIVSSGYSANEFSGAGSAFNANVSLVIKNPTNTANVPPSHPTDLNVSGSRAAVTLSWLPGVDATTPQKSLSFNIFLVNDQGKTFYYPLADTATGKLTLQKLGNVQLNRSWTIKDLPAGNYCWGVQDIDNTFIGSTFAKSCFTIKPDGTLPVVLAAFSVYADGNRARIQWTTATEQNSDHFKIEHATDGHNFSLFTTVKAQGNSSAAKNYVVYDDYPARGINYYRLTYYDKDGKATVYDIKTVSFTVGGKTFVIVYPNPVTKDFGIKISNYAGKQVSVVLTDLSGKIIHKEVIQTNSTQEYYKINLTGKPVSGTYILKVTGDNFTTGLKVFVN